MTRRNRILGLRVRSGRLIAGLLAGMAGGVALGFPFYAVLIADAEALAGPLTPGVFWILHMLLSTTIGGVFSLFVAPRSYFTSIPTALVVLLVGVYGGGRIVLLVLAGVTPTFDTRAVIEILGHVVYAIVMGGGYVAIHRLEIRDASRAKSAKWRAWAREEERAA